MACNIRPVIANFDALPINHEGDCRDHRAEGGPQDPAASGEGWSPASGAGSRFV